MTQAIRKKRLSSISILHYFKLVFRSLLFIAVLAGYVYHRFAPFSRSYQILTAIVWVIFMFEMFLRFFPSRLESMGCQKQFKRNYVPRCPSNTVQVRSGWKSTFTVVVSWCALNGVIGILRLCRVIDNEVLILICLFFSVCDMICILFFCPFQTWMMKNKCCVACRIYNWDFAMMFTPLLFIPSFYTWSLLGCALLLLLRWEIAYRKHPEFFSVETNDSLNCKNCREKLCEHKKQLRSFWESERNRLNERIDKARDITKRR